MTKPTPDAVIAKYISDRNKISELNKQIDAIKALQSKREDWLANEMKQNKEKGKNTEAGACHFYDADSATVADPLLFKDWVGEDFENRKDYLNNAVNKSAVKQDVDDGKVPPLGINYVKVKKVRVVSPKKTKGEKA
jgi:hypothetical protein